MDHILLIEDDVNIAELISLHLHELGCELTVEHNGRVALEKAMSNDYNLILLDVMLPEVNGFDICSSVRKKKKYTPILMITSKSEEEDKIMGLEIGADDYLTKPFSIKELIARVKAILRRNEALNNDALDNKKKLTYKNLTVDIENRIIIVNGKRVELSPKEFDLLYLLARHPGRSYSRQQLLDNIWGYEFDGFDHTVNSHINRLRAKIEEDMTDPRFVLTTWGVGYRFNSNL